MRIRTAIPDELVTPETIDPVLEAVTRVNERLVSSGQSPTSHELIARGARWRPENLGDEHFDHGATIAARGWGDCDDWAPLHAATLRVTGEDPGAFARVVPSGPNTFHAIVQRSHGGIDDPSVAAGMKPGPSVSGAGEMMAYVCDPHDGRIYQGAMLPTVGPLSLHCGLQHSVRGCSVIGGPTLYEARVDVPMVGSRLVHVRAYARHRPRRHRGRHHHVGALPFALSVSHIAGSAHEALCGALVGAAYCGDAAGMASDVDRYKLLAMQGAMTGLSPGELRESLIHAMQADLQAKAQATGTDPRAHSVELLRDLAASGHIDGYIAGVIQGVVVGSFFSDIAHAASGVVNAVKGVVSKVGPWVGTIVHGLQSIVSMVPGIGTVVSDVLASAESAYDEIAAVVGGNPLEGAIKAAYNYATATVPGASALRFVLDPVVNTLLALVIKKEPVETAIMNGILSDVPTSPSIGPLTPRSVASTLAHLILSHLGAKKSPPGARVVKPAPLSPAAGGIAHGAPIVVHPNPAVHAHVVQASHAVARATPSRVIKLTTRPAVTAAKPAAPPPKALPPAPKPLGVAHAAMAAHPTSPPHPTAAPAPALTAAPAKPGMPPGTSHWHCAPLPGGQWACSWQ